MRSTSILALVLFTAFGCRGSDNGPTPDSPTSGGDKIQDIQNDAMAPGTAVNLKGVVVTAVDAFGAKTGDFWVEEPEGGPFSGVHVFKADVSVVATLNPGDIVDIKGAQKSEFALSGSGGDNTGRTVTELEPMTGGALVVTKTGTGTTPAPSMVDALAIGRMYDASMASAGGGAAFSNAWEQWEGVLITLTNVSATSAPKAFGSATPTPADNYSFGITGVAKIEGSLTDINSSGIVRTTCFANATGVLDYFFDYLLLPRSAADMATGGTNCPAAEQAVANNGTVCTDGIDNDANGFSDCNDLGCEAGPNAWLGASCTAGDAMCGCSKNLASGSSVNTVNTTMNAASSPAMLRNVYVTAINGTTSYWVADSLTAAANGGVFVFSAPPVGLTVGQKLATLQGVAGPFGTGTKITEITTATAGAASAGGTPMPMTVATETLSSLTAGVSYAGSLVTLTKAKVTAAVNNKGQVELTDTNGKKIFMDDGAFKFYGGTSAASSLAPAVGTCLVVTGMMDLQLDPASNSVRTIDPRSAADMAAATGCS